MSLWIPGTADPGHVLTGQYFSAKTNYNVVGTMPIKTPWNGDGTSANHHLAKDIASTPGTLWLRPVIPADPPTAFQGDVWIQKSEPNFNPTYWRSDVTMFGLQGTMPVRGAGGTVTPGPTAQTKSAGYWSSDITISAVSVPAGSVRAGVTIAGTTGTLAVQATGPQTITPGTSNIVKGAGIYDGAITIVGSPDGIASNIRQGKVINGVTGTLVEGKRSKNGTGSPGSSLVVSGLGFDPYIVTVSFTADGYYYVYTGIDGKWLWGNYAGGPGGTYSNGGASSDTWTNDGFTLTAGMSGASSITWRAWEL